MERFVGLLNHLHVTVEDMNEKEGWVWLLLNTIQFSEGTQHLSLEFSTQRRPGLRSEALGAASEISEKLGAVGDLESCRGLLRWTEEEINTRLPYISTASS